MKNKRNRHGAVGKSFSEQHFVNPPKLPLLCEIYGALHLARPGLAGRQAGGQADRQAGRQAGNDTIHDQIT